MQSLREVYDLLASLFTADELRRFLSYHYADELVANLPERASKAEFVDAAVGALDRRGLLQQEFVRRLQTARPERTQDIARVFVAQDEATDDRQSPVQTFCYFAGEDAAAAASLRIHLTPLIHRRQLQFQSCASQVAGHHEAVWLAKHLSRAELLIFLVSPSLLSGDHQSAIAQAMARNHAASVRLVPVLLRSLEGASPFADLASLPSQGRFVADFDDEDEAWNAVGTGLCDVVRELRKEARS